MVDLGREQSFGKYVPMSLHDGAMMLQAVCCLSPHLIYMPVPVDHHSRRTSENFERNAENY